MIAYFHVQQEDLARFRIGPLGPHLADFAEVISRQGYRRKSAWQKIRLVAALSRWLSKTEPFKGRLRRFQPKDHDLEFLQNL